MIITLCVCLYVPTLGRKQCLCLGGFFTVSSVFYHLFPFQNYQELQPEGDPGSSVRSEPTPTLHVSKYSIFDNHVSRAFKIFVMICNA